MIRSIIYSIYFITSFACYGQLYDRVNIYAIHTGTSFAGDNVDADYIRVNHKYKFTSTDRYYIDSLSNYFFKDIATLPPYTYNEISSSIRVVIDFIHRERTTSFVLINAGYVFYLSEGHTMKEGWFQLRGDEICDVSKVIPFFNMLHYRSCN